MDIYKVAQFGLPGGNDIGVPSQVDSLQKIVDLSINTIASLAAIGFFIMLIVGGYQFLTASGNQQQAEKAKSTLTTAAIGIVLIALAYPVVMFVAGLLGLGTGFSGAASGSPAGLIQRAINLVR